MYKKTSLLDGFELPNITHENIKQQLIKLGNSHLVRQRKSIDGLPIEERLKIISDEVMKILSRYKDFVRVIYDENELNQYIDYVINKGEQGILAFDTETNNSLDPLTCKLMGLCLYIPNTKPVYVPINHCYPETDTLLPNQVSMQCITDICNKIKNSDIKLIYHNGKFDIRVCYNTAGVYLPIWWDTMIAAQLIDENEQAKLKVQYKAHVDSTMSEYNIENLFTGLPYAWISPELFAYYAAIDSYDTYLLQQKQQRYFEESGNEKLYNLFMNIEMPIVTVTAEMEDSGIHVDTDYTERLNKKYQSITAKYRKDIDEILEPYKDKISYYQSIGKIDNPVNYDSAAQLTIILYDILETPVGADGKKSTDKATLKAIKTPFTETILKYRHYNKLITSFTEPLPKLISKRDNKLHAHFNQMGKEERGVRTGRFSSTDPNLQQIPSHEASMRLMFSASPNHVIVGGDFSQQEPRLLTHICKDKNLIDTYIAGKDLYATIGSKIFKKDYWECMEHWEDGSPNPTGKDIRKMCKQIVLATMYGMGAKLLASMINVDIEKCREILDEFYKMFPSVKEFAQSNELKAKNIGYVEDYMGRRRHLPDASLPEISVDAKRDVITDCSKIFVDCIPTDDKIEISDKELTYKWQSIYNNDYRDSGFNAKAKFKELAKKSNIGVVDNGAFISKATTQCVNASIQGCLDGQVRVFTKEYGIVNIAKLSNKAVTVWDGHAWSSAIVLPSGSKQKCVVNFSNGQRIVCSPNHLFARVPASRSVKRNLHFTACEDLEVGDRIRTCEEYSACDNTYVSVHNDSKAHNSHNYYLDMIKDSFDRGMFLGRLASDGSINNRTDGAKSIRFIIAEHEKDVVDKLLAIIPFEYRLTSVLREGRNQTLYYIDIYSKTLVEEIVSLNIKHHIDDRIFSDSEMLRGFLCGMFDGDGTARYYLSLTFGAQDDFTQYTNDIQKALLFFGIRSSVKRYSTCYHVNVKAQDCSKFAERIDFISDEKRHLVRELSCKLDGHIFKDVLIVQSVEITDDYVDMYDVCNTERGYFVADGIVTHNSAATLTKKAMVIIHNNRELKDLGFKLLIPVHDELLGECPIENAERCGKLLSQLMIDAAKPECSVPMKVDTYTVKHWYADELNDIIQESYHKMLSKGNTHEQAVTMLEREYPELKAGIVDDICRGNFNVMVGDV